MATPLPPPTIGVLLPMDASHATAFLRGIHRAATNYGTRYIIYGTTWADMFERIGKASHPPSALGYDHARLDGTILCFGTPDLIDHFVALHREGHPCVFTLRSGGDVPCIVPDDERRMAALVERFYRHGHRRIAMLRGDPGNPSAQRRFRGYCAGLERVGLPLDPAIVFSGDHHMWSAEHHTGEAFDRGARFTVLITFNDNSALGALKALRARGLNVPLDVEVASVDDIASAAFTDPPLTTFRLPMEEIGFAAMEQMTRVLKGETVPVERTVPPILVQRQSTRFRDDDPLLDTAPDPLPPLDPHTDLRLLRLAETVPCSAPFAQTIDATRLAVQECISRGLDLPSLTTLVAERATGVAAAGGPGDDASLPAVLELVRTASRFSHNRALERARFLHSLTVSLRRTSFEALDEPIVLEVLRRALPELGFTIACLHLRGGVANTEPDVLHRWNLLDGEARRFEFVERDLPAEIARIAADHSPTLVTSLSAGGIIVGHLITDGGHAQNEDLAEIVRYVSSALHGIRLYRQLGQSHETLRQSESSLRETQRELVETSRRAGIAEIATGVLHNVGNALNAVNTSTGVVASRVGKLRFDALAKVAQLLLREDEPWGDLFRTQERGRKVVEFLSSLDTHLRHERDELVQELEALREGVEHINQIVASQQRFAQVSGFVEEFDPVEIPEYALRLCETELLRHGIAIVREYLPAPAVRMERHKAVQVLVNLIRNAKESLALAAQAEKSIVVGLRTSSAGEVQCYVSDNGVGIAPENRGRLFTMGFSTKKGGHGFGLHNCALIASSLGGSLDAQSEGLGRGATFVLTLPAALDPALPAA